MVGPDGAGAIFGEGAVVLGVVEGLVLDVADVEPEGGEAYRGVA